MSPLLFLWLNQSKWCKEGSKKKIESSCEGVQRGKAEEGVIKEEKNWKVEDEKEILQEVVNIDIPTHGHHLTQIVRMRKH